MPQSTNPIAESAIICGLLKMIDASKGGPVVCADTEPTLIGDFVEHLASAVRDRLVEEVTNVVVAELTERLLAELPWRLADEVQTEFETWAPGVASDLAAEVTREVEANLADALSELPSGN